MNMFFHLNKSNLTRMENEIVMEDYEFCFEWDKEDPKVPVCKKWVTCGRLKSSTPVEIPYTAYVINGKEFKKLPKVGEFDGKDILHVLSDNMNLKDDPRYLCGSYVNMQKDHPELSNAVMDVIYILDDEKFRVKKQAWIDAGSLGTSVETRIPHVYAGQLAD